jgi:CubicO group peptidase (beta-lactamase class C family)
VRRKTWIAIVTVLCAAGLAGGATGQSGAPGRVIQQSALVDQATLTRVDALVEDAIRHKQLPGAVLLVGRGGAILYQKAYGHRALVPAAEPMTLDTIFDLASLTKVVATTTSIMQLVEQGRIRLNDRVATFIPDFGRYGKDSITIRHLLTHTSGLRPDLDLAEPWMGYDTAIRLAAEEVPPSAPGERFVYSDINFFLLGDIVSRVSGVRLDQFAAEHIFKPLGMSDTMFNPPERLRARIAPTQLCTPYGWPCEGPAQVMLRGIVHDPTARRMGGVAGHAGLFSTASDLSRFCRMILGGGALGGVRVLSPLAVARMTSPAPAPAPGAGGGGGGGRGAPRHAPTRRR